MNMHMHQGDSSLSITQWNCRSIVPKIELLKQYIATANSSVIALSETWLNSKKNIRLNGFDIIREDRADSYGGVALAISHRVPYATVGSTTLSQGPIQAVAVKLSEVNIYVISAYRPPNRPVTENCWRQFLSSLPTPFVLCGDLNAYSQLWNPHYNPAGKSLEKVIDDLNLVVVNDGRSTIIPTSMQTSNAPDVTICSAGLALSITWEVKMDPMGSDHYPIEIQIVNNKKSTQNTKKNTRIKWKTKNADWSLFGNIVDAELNQAGEPDECPDNLNNLLVRSITKAADTSMQRFSATDNRRRREPVDPRLRYIRARRNAAVKAYVTNMSEESYAFYKRTDAMCKAEARDIARESFKEFCRSVNSDTPINKVWKKIGELKGNKREERRIDPAVLWQFHKNISPEEETEPVDLEFSNGDLMLSENIILAEIERVLDGRDDSAPGIDGIQYSHVRNLPSSGKELLCKLFNTVLKRGIPPAAWKQNLITPILKPGKPVGSATSYRPIVLSPCIAKVYELVLMKRLEYYMEKLGLYGMDQTGFRPDFSTMDTAATFVVDVQKSNCKGERTVACMMDVSDAYGNVSLSILAAEMQELGIPSKFIESITNVLYARVSAVLNDGEIVTDFRTHRKGLGQGSPISPILFSIYLRKLSSILPKNVKSIQYADDFTVWISWVTLAGAYIIMNEALKNIHKFLSNRKLELSTTKTVIMVFNSKRSDVMPVCRIQGETLPVVKNTKMLGMTIDDKLDWKAHIEGLVLNQKRALNILRVLCGTDYGSDAKCLLMLYRSLVRSKLDYGSFLYSSAAKNQLQRVDVVHNQGLRLCIGAMSSTPNEALYVEVNERPLAERRKQLALKYALDRLNTNRPIIRQIEELNEVQRIFKPQKELTLLGRTVDAVRVKCADFERNDLKPYFALPWAGTFFVPKIFIPDPDETPDKLMGEGKINSWHEAWITSIAPNYCRVYTDGSKTPQAAGYGVNAEELQISKRLPMEATVYSAEGVALLRACETLVRKEAGPSIVITDSLSWLSRLAHPPDSKSTSLECAIREIIRSYHRPIFLAFCPAHCGIWGNEEADALAKAGTVSELDPIPLPHNDLYLAERKKIMQSWQTRWETEKNGRRLFAIKDM